MIFPTKKILVECPSGEQCSNSAVKNAMIYTAWEQVYIFCGLSALQYMPVAIYIVPGT